MRNFYDIGGKSSQNIPRFLNKYGAQWGAKIQTIDMQGSENTYQVPAIEVTDAMKESVLYEGQPLYQERVMTTSRGVEVIQNATGEELSQMRKEFMERTGLPRSMADVRTTYDEQGNDYAWIAYEGMHASVEPYINKRFNTRTHQQWEWWKRADKDEYPTDYSYIRIDDRFQERDPDYRTKRDILAGAFDSVAQTEGEKRNLKEYKNLIGSLNRMEEEARGLRQANTAERKKPERDKTVI